MFKKPNRPWEGMPFIEGPPGMGKSAIVADLMWTPQDWFAYAKGKKVTEDLVRWPLGRIENLEGEIAEWRARRDFWKDAYDTLWAEKTKDM